MNDILFHTLFSLDQEHAGPDDVRDRDYIRIRTMESGGSRIMHLVRRTILISFINKIIDSRLTNVKMLLQELKADRIEQLKQRCIG